MISDKKWESMLSETDFEFTLDELKEYLTEPIANLLYRWLEKYKLNIRRVIKLRLENCDDFIAPSELDKDDPNYDEFDSWPKFAKADAADDVRFAADACREFAVIEEYLPRVEFTRESVFGEEEKEEE